MKRSISFTKLRFRGAPLLIVISIMAGVCQAQAAEGKPTQAAIQSLRVIPDSVTLAGPQVAQHFLVLAKYRDRMERDVTTQAHFLLSAPGKGQIDNTGKFIGLAPGEIVLTVEVGKRTAKSDIQIQNPTTPRPFTFTRDIGGILTRKGCNDTSCHGSVKGRGAGFKLSPAAMSPREDYKWITEGGTFRVLTADTEPKNPRINLKEPEKSLVLLKPTFSVPHGGGLRFEVDSPEYQTILNWIRGGAPFGDEQANREVVAESIEVFPRELVLDVGGKQQLIVTAHLAKGRTEDITSQVRFSSGDSSVAEVNDAGLLHAWKPGEANVLIRATGGHSLSATVGVIQKPIANYPKIESRNYIDQFVFKKLQNFHVLPSELSTDDEFLRRVCLDLTGTLPPPNRVRQFLADKNPRKREQLIEILLNSPEYVDYWSFRFSDLLRATYVATSTVLGTQSYEDWVTDSIASNKPYDVMARERIAAQGFSSPARNFYYLSELSTPELVMPETVRMFMGRRIECAQCHNHPFEAWTQNQFWGLAAFFSGYSELRDHSLIIDVLGGGHVDQPKEMMVTNPRTKEKVLPTFLDGMKLPENQWMDPRMRLAEWMTSHPYFAEAGANRVWSYFFGRGIVDPVDDFRSTNPPTNPELLEALAKDFRESHYDIKHLIRTIVLSRTYQLSATPNGSNKEDAFNYSHALPRPLDAAVLLDAISSATGVPERFEFHRAAGGGDPPMGERAVQTIPDLCPSQFLDAFGRSMRKALPVGPPKPNLLEAMHMQAGSTYNSKITHEGGRLDRLLKVDKSDDQIIAEFYLAALSRFPTVEEKTKLLGILSQRSSRRQETLAGLVWAVISSREFAYNH